MQGLVLVTAANNRAISIPIFQTRHTANRSSFFYFYLNHMIYNIDYYRNICNDRIYKHGKRIYNARGYCKQNTRIIYGAHM